MSRVEENAEVLKKTKGRFSGKAEDVMCSMTGEILGILMDISKSLAVIADNTTEYIHSETEAPMSFISKFEGKWEEDDDGRVFKRI